jgi:hypothetical protein
MPNESAQETEAYAGAPAEGPARVALVAGSGPVEGEGLYQLLRGRLLMLSAFLAGTEVLILGLRLLIRA